VHADKPSSKQFLTSKPTQWLNYASQEVLQIMQAPFNFPLGLSSTKASDFKRSLDLKIRCKHIAHNIDEKLEETHPKKFVQFEGKL